jgi:hypothetical protein
VTKILKTPTILILALLIVVIGCKNKQEREGYRVVAYDGTNHHWTLIQTDSLNGEHQTKRIVIECLLYQKGKEDIRTGPDVCDLRVGRNMVPNKTPDNDRAKLLSVYALSNGFYFTEGSGDNRISQQFKIIDEKLVDAH